MAAINWKTFHQAEFRILQRALIYRGWSFTKGGKRDLGRELKKLETMRLIALENHDSELEYLTRS